jgi:hypothetical protein
LVDRYVYWYYYRSMALKTWQETRTTLSSRIDVRVTDETAAALEAIARRYFSGKVPDAIRHVLAVGIEEVNNEQHATTQGPG